MSINKPLILVSNDDGFDAHLSFLLLFEQLALTAHVAAIALGCNVLAHLLHRPGCPKWYKAAGSPRKGPELRLPEWPAGLPGEWGRR